MSSLEGEPSEPTAFDRRGIAILLAGLLIVVLGLAQTAYRLSLPSDGWGLATVSETFQSDQFRFLSHVDDRPSPIRNGDRLVAVEGRPIETILSDALAVRPVRPAVWTDGGSAHYTVTRDGQRLDLDVDLRSLTPGEIALRLAESLLATPSSWLLLGIGLFVLLRRPQSGPAQLLYLVGSVFMTGSVGLAVTGSAGDAVTDMLYGTAFWPGQLFHRLSWSLFIAPLAVHLFLIFPVAKRPVVAFRRWALMAIYGLTPALGLATAAVWQGDPLTWWRQSLNESSIISLGLTVVLAATIAHTLITVREPVARAQIRWVAWSIFLVTVASLVGFLAVMVGAVEEHRFFEASLLLIVPFPLALAASILRYRLFEIDVIINRTLVYAGLTASIVAIYVLIVGGASLVLQAGAGVAPGLVATGIVAVLFQPLRERVQHGLNRLMYGEREDPYTVLSRLSERLQAAISPGQVLPNAAETIALAMKLPFVEIEVRIGDEVESMGRYGQPPVRSLEFPLIDRAELVGRLLVAPGATQELAPADVALLQTLSRPAAVAAQTVRLNGELQRARERLVTAREEERRRLRLELGGTLAPSIELTRDHLAMARDLIRRDPAAAEEALTQVKAEVQGAIGEIRRVAHDLRPPVLDQLGLVAALREHGTHLAETPASRHGGALGEGGLLVTVEAPEALPVLPAAVEVAAFRIGVGALDRLARTGAARRCSVSLSVDGQLELAIRAERSGDVAAATWRWDDDLLPLRDQAEELGGTCHIEAGPSELSLTAGLPLRVAADDAAA